MPWNYPTTRWPASPRRNLVLGNTIVLKHAETCPRSALAIQQIMDDAGVPEGVYITVFASLVHELLIDPRIQGVSDRLRVGRRDHRGAGRQCRCWNWAVPT